MEYLSLPEGGIYGVGINNYYHDNREGDLPGRIDVTDSATVTNSATIEKIWAESYSESMTISASVTGKLFGMGAEGSSEYTTTDTTSESTSYEHSRQTGVDMEVGVPAHKYYWVEVLYWQGTFQIQFRPQYSFELKSGDTVNWPRDEQQPIAGIASGNMFSKSTILPIILTRGPPTTLLLLPRRIFLETTVMKRQRNEKSVCFSGDWVVCLFMQL